MGTILFLYESDVIKLDKQELFEFLASKTLRNFSFKKFYNSTLKAFYLDAYDFILKHLSSDTVAIKVYYDNAIRLYTFCDCNFSLDVFSMCDLNFAESVVFEDPEFCTNSQTADLIKELITFARAH